MDVYFTRRSSFGRASPAGSESFGPDDYRTMLNNLNVPEEMPFLIADDGSYDVLLNAFLRQLPSAGCRSPQTWKAYANDIACLQRFLSEERSGLHVLHASHADMVAYHAERRGGSPPSIAATSWNRGLAGLEKLFDWGWHAGHVRTSPFHYSTSHRSSRHPGTSRINSLHESDDGDEGVKCCTISQYRIFRDVGLGGLLGVGGRLDPSFNGRNRVRNLAIADYLLNTGTRITEAVSVLKAEMPRLEGLPPGTKLLPMPLAPYVAKRLRGRRIMVSVRSLREHIEPYASWDRAEATAQGRGEGGGEGAYASLEDPILVENAFSDRCRLVGGEELKYARLDPKVRRSLFMVGPDGSVREPAMLFLREDGLPTTADNIRAVFQRACIRCERLGHHIDISPHTLRHTFAVCMLTQLIRATLRRHEVGSPIDFKNMDPAKEQFRAVTLDPVDHLRRLLGHRSVETTYRYLTYIQEAEDAVSEAFHEWDAVLGAPPPLPVADAAEEQV